MVKIVSSSNKRIASVVRRLDGIGLTTQDALNLTTQQLLTEYKNQWVKGGKKGKKPTLNSTAGNQRLIKQATGLSLSSSQIKFNIDIKKKGLSKRAITQKSTKDLVKDYKITKNQAKQFKKRYKTYQKTGKEKREVILKESMKQTQNLGVSKNSPVYKEIKDRLHESLNLVNYDNARFEKLVQGYVKRFKMDRKDAEARAHNAVRIPKEDIKKRAKRLKANKDERQLLEDYLNGVL